MAGHGSKSDQQREEAIIALLSEKSVEEAARVVGIAATTLYRWLKEPAFDALYREAKRTAHSQSIAQLVGGLSAVVTTLLEVMVDRKTPAATKVRAAEKAIEIEDLQARVTELERIAEAAKGPKK
jgi:transposase-like protein